MQSYFYRSNTKISQYPNMQKIALFRLQNQQITHPKFSKIKDVAAWQGATQAQDFTHAKWAIGLRLPGTTDADLEAAIDRAEIIRTHLLRPTWHFVAAEDARWMLRLSKPQILPVLFTMDKQIGLDEKIYQNALPILAKSLENGRQLTREELMLELQKHGIPTTNSTATHLMMRAELEEIVCNGVRRGKQFTYALLDERVPKTKILDRPEAIAELARRYFSSHAPATLQDFQWWSGLKMADARAGLQAAKPNLVSETIEKQVFWLPSHFQPKPAAPLSVHLLPAFDEFLVSYKNRTASLSSEKNAQIITGNGIFKPVVLVNGQVRGIWQRTFKKDKIVIEKTLFSDLDEAENAAFERSAAQFSDFVGMKIEQR